MGESPSRSQSSGSASPKFVMRSRTCILAHLAPRPKTGKWLTRRGAVKVGDLGLGRMMSAHTFEAHSKVGTPLRHVHARFCGVMATDCSSGCLESGRVLDELANVLKSRI